MEILELKNKIIETEKLTGWVAQQKGGREERISELEDRITEITQSE